MAQASTSLEFATSDAGRQSRVGVTVQNGKMRIEQGTTGWMLYDSAKNVVAMVDPQRKSYVELTRDEMRVYGQQISAARKLLDENLKGMLPEQRAAIEKMMGGATRPSPLVFQSTGQKRKVAGYDCTGGRLTRNGKVQEEVCLAAAKDIKMPEGDFATVRSMYKLMHEMQELGAPGILPDFSEIDGVPIEIRNPNGDYQRLSSVSNDRVAEAKFVVPADYTKESVVEALGRGKSAP
jgi:hypothetical protein